MTIDGKYSYAIGSWLDEATRGLCDAAQTRALVVWATQFTAWR